MIDIIGVLLIIIIDVLWLVMMCKTPKAGTIIVNTTDPSKDVLSIELEIDIDKLKNSRKVEFDIKDESSQ